MVSKNTFYVQSDLSEFINVSDNFIICNIKEHELKNEEYFPYSEYVVYRIDLNSSIKNWSIWKRYKDFKELRDLIHKNNYIINLPNFPEKKIFNKSKETIDQRKKLLTAFLNFLFAKMKMRYFKEVINFIEIDKDTLSLISKKNELDSISMTFNNKSTILKQIDKTKEDNDNQTENKNSSQNYYTKYLDYRLGESQIKNAYMQVIEEFLKNLNEKYENKTNIVKNFEIFLKSKKNWPQFKTEEIFKLFFGEYDKVNCSYIIHGMLSHIGKYEENILGAEACLKFLVKLLECEFNPEYEKYISVLKQMKKEHLETMKLDYHLANNKIKIQVFKLLKCLYEHNNPKLDQILDECNLLTPYKNYLINDEIIN
jgi:hypothetical protein